MTLKGELNCTESLALSSEGDPARLLLFTRYLTKTHHEPVLTF